MGMVTHSLSDNFVVYYEDGLDGGGIAHLPDFKNAVSLAGKEHYTSAVEWCAGFGVIGFDFLHSEMCNHMSFIDCHEPATKWLNRTIENNNIESKSTVYLADKIELIPDDVKWDLVLANPPHCLDATLEHFNKSDMASAQKADVIRLTCDVDGLIHKEFFENIRKHLLPGADLFISEISQQEAIDSMAIESGLEIVGYYPAPKLSINSQITAVIYHLREPL